MTVVVNQQTKFIHCGRCKEKITHYGKKEWVTQYSGTDKERNVRRKIWKCSVCGQVNKIGD